MKKALSLILALITCLVLCACASTSTTPQATKPSVESLYAELVTCAKTGDYVSGKRLYISNTALQDYKDAADYYQYCVIIDGHYSKGRLGYTYRKLSEISPILDVADILATIEKKVGMLEGMWKEDNGVGSYLYLSFKNGYMASEVVNYADADTEVVFEDKDYLSEVVEITYTDGSTGLAIKDSYALTYFKDKQQVMLIKLAEGKYNTFNGVYDKVK